MDTFNYFESELRHVTGSAIRLKIEGSGGGTRWLSLNEKQFDAVEALLIKLDEEERQAEHTENLSKIRSKVRERLHHVKVGRVLVSYRSLNHYEATALVHDEDGDIHKEYFTVLMKAGEVEFQN